MRFTKSLAGAAVAVFIAVGGAQAHTIHVDLTSVTDNGNGTFTWLYSANLTGGNQLNKNDGFSIVDFAGFVPGSAAVVTNHTGGVWSGSAAPVGPFAQPVNGVVTNSSTPDITFTYSGPIDAVATDTDVLDFSVKSKIGNIGIGQNGYQDHVTSASFGTAGKLDQGHVQTNVPSVPEPAFFQLGSLLGMACLGGLGRIRKNRLA